MTKMKLALFASGNGSNAIAIINHFEKHQGVEIAFVLSNKSNAPIVQKAENLGVKVITVTNEEASNSVFLLNLMEDYSVDYIILAGYLRKIPSELIQNFQDKIINVHPSLLPKYGGKGMYGKFVHEKVIENKEKESGITIHFVNENFDDGMHIAQFHTWLEENETVESLQKKISKLELNYFPVVIEKVICS